MGYVSNKNKTDIPTSVDLAIKYNILKLADKDGLVRKKARELLVKIGQPVIDYLSEIETHPKDIARWEAVKALTEINHPDAAPLLVNALEDSNEDVRWIAAEGLGALGDTGLNAILESLLEYRRTVYLRKGAHHVLTRLAEHSEKPIIRELLQILDEPDAELKLPLKIKPYLEKINSKKKR